MLQLLCWIRDSVSLDDSGEVQVDVMFNAQAVRKPILCADAARIIILGYRPDPLV